MSGGIGKKGAESRLACQAAKAFCRIQCRSPAVAAQIIVDLNPLNWGPVSATNVGIDNQHLCRMFDRKNGPYSRGNRPQNEAAAEGSMTRGQTRSGARPLPLFIAHRLGRFRSSLLQDGKT
jgi:hypothetical protein